MAGTCGRAATAQSALEGASEARMEIARGPEVPNSGLRQLKDSYYAAEPRILPLPHGS